MAQVYSTEEVLQLLLENGDDDTEVDDPWEVIMKGSDEEFADLDELAELEIGK